jgi:hypothetical protein
MRTTYRSTRRALAFAGVAIALTACMMFRRPPSAPQAYERTQTSATGMYKATFVPVESIKVGRLHSWKIQVTTSDGAPVTDAKFVVDGGMPQHGHGLPTRPVVTQPAGESYELVEGMKFNMGGWWVVKLHIDGAKGSDVVTFNLKL